MTVVAIKLIITVARWNRPIVVSYTNVATIALNGRQLSQIDSGMELILLD